MKVWVVCNISDDGEPCPVVFKSRRLAEHSLLTQFNNGRHDCWVDENEFMVYGGQKFHIYECEIHGEIQSL